MGKRNSFKTGFYISQKTHKRMEYRSSYELRLMKCLDADKDVVDYKFEEVIINHKQGRVLTPDEVSVGGIHKKLRSYTPDFVVDYSDGRKLMIEVKSMGTVNSRPTQRKKNLGEQYCAMHGLDYKIWTLLDIIPYEIKLNIEMPDHEAWEYWQSEQY